MKSKRLVFGVGVNDLPHHRIKGCIYYQQWKRLLDRCHGPARHRYRTQHTLCNDWVGFSTFYNWASSQCLAGKHLVCNGAEYSPTTCIFVEPRLSKLVLAASCAKVRYNGRFQAAFTINGKRRFFTCRDFSKTRSKYWEMKREAIGEVPGAEVREFLMKRLAFVAGKAPPIESLMRECDKIEPCGRAVPPA